MNFTVSARVYWFRWGLGVSVQWVRYGWRGLKLQIGPLQVECFDFTEDPRLDDYGEDDDE